MKKLSNAKTIFSVNGVIYTETMKGYFYKTTGGVDKLGQPLNMRIPKHVFEMAFEEYLQTSQDNADADEWESEMSAEIEARKDAEAEKDAETEKNFNKKQTKKASKPRKSKDIAYEYKENNEVVLTLTAKQVDFIMHLSDSCFWENGLDSTLWCDVLADEIGGQFDGKPMTVGAMISTLREKNIIDVARDASRVGKPKYMWLTDLGKQVATGMGLA